MSTDYTTFRGPTSDLVLVEHSSKLDMVVDWPNTGPIVLYGDLTPRQVVTIALEMLKVASYVDGDLVESMKGQDPYTIAELRRALV